MPYPSYLFFSPTKYLYWNIMMHILSHYDICYDILAHHPHELNSSEYNWVGTNEMFIA